MARHPYHGTTFQRGHGPNGPWRLELPSHLRRRDEASPVSLPGQAVEDQGALVSRTLTQFLFTSPRATSLKAAPAPPAHTHIHTPALRSRVWRSLWPGDSAGSGREDPEAAVLTRSGRERRAPRLWHVVMEKRLCETRPGNSLSLMLGKRRRSPETCLPTAGSSAVLWALSHSGAMLAGEESVPAPPSLQRTVSLVEPFPWDVEAAGGCTGPSGEHQFCLRVMKPSCLPGWSRSRSSPYHCPGLCHFHREPASPFCLAGWGR